MKRGLTGAEGAWREAWFVSDPTARVIVTRALDVLHANEAAHALLRAEQGAWRLERGRLSAPPAELDRLRDKLAKLGVGAEFIVALPLVIRLHSLSVDGDAVALAIRDLSEGVRVKSADLEVVFGLTPAEQNTLLLLIRGLSAQEIAARMNKSVLTVRTHLKHLHVKLGVKSREQLFARVLPYLFLD